MDEVQLVASLFDLVAKALELALVIGEAIRRYKQRSRR
jgi:hypothetical protein